MKRMLDKNVSFKCADTVYRKAGLDELDTIVFSPFILNNRINKLVYILPLDGALFIQFLVPAHKKMKR